MNEFFYPTLSYYLFYLGILAGLGDTFHVSYCGQNIEDCVSSL